MEEHQKQHVRRRLVQLVKATKCSNDFFEKLTSNLILSQGDVDELNRLDDAVKKSGRLYEILLARLGLYEMLQKSLEETGQDGAMKLLLQDGASEDCTVGSITFDRRFELGTGKRGSSSKVFLGKFGRTRTEVEVAVKELNTNCIDKAAAVQTIEGLLSLSPHRNVARYHGVEYVNSSIYIASDLAFITLQDEVKMDLLKLDKRTILNGSTKGLDHLHKLKILHKNLKPSNVLLGSNCQVKITDFGLPKGISTFLVIGGAADWMSPEILKMLYENDDNLSDKDIEKMFTKESDVFALGCICFFAFTSGLHPFGKNVSTQHNIVQYNPNLQNSNVDDKWQKLIKAMIAEHPRDRFPVEKILAEIQLLGISNGDRDDVTIVVELPPQPQPGPSTSVPREVSAKRAKRKNNDVVASEKKQKIAGASTPIGDHRKKKIESKFGTLEPSIAEEKRNSADNAGNNLIHQAVINGKSVAEIGYLVSQGVNWKAKNKFGSTPLHQAAAEGHIDALTYMLNLEGSNLEEKNSAGMTPLLCASSAIKNSLKTFTILLGSDADKNAVDPQGDNLLFLAVFNGRSKPELSLIAKSGVKWKNAKNNCLEGILHIAAKVGNLEALEYFIGLGADVHDRDISGKTALHMAAYPKNKRFIETINLLKANGADIKAVDDEGSNVLFDAAFHGRPIDEVKHLQNLSIPWNRRNTSGQSLLHFSVIGGNVEAVKYFLSLGLSPDEKDISGETALLKVASAAQNITELLTVFAERNADFDAVDNEKNNLLLLAVLKEASKADLEHICRLDIDWKAKNSQRQGVLHMAAKGGNAEAIDYFVTLGANVNANDKNKEKPIHLVAKTEDGFVETLTSLIKNGATLDDWNDRVFLDDLLKHVENQAEKELISQEKAQQLKDLINGCVIDK